MADILTIGAVTYPDFKLLDVIDPEQFDTNFDDLVDKIDEIIPKLNLLENTMDSVVDGSSGADKTGLTAISPISGTTVQSFLENLITRLEAIADGTSGADLIGATAIAGLAGTKVQALLEALKIYIDTHIASSDHDTKYYTETELDAGQLDNRYYTETEINATVLDLAGVGRTTQTLKNIYDDLQNHKNSSDHDDRYYSEDEMDAFLVALQAQITSDSSALTTHKTSNDHDSRYYTETEMDTLLSGKSSALHTHDTWYIRRTNTDAFTPTSNYHPATKKYVDDIVSGAGAGNMLKTTYDTDNDGVVDNAEDSQKLGGYNAETYAKAPITNNSIDIAHNTDAYPTANVVSDTGSGRGPAGLFTTGSKYAVPHMVEYVDTNNITIFLNEDYLGTTTITDLGSQVYDVTFSGEETHLLITLI